MADWKAFQIPIPLSQIVQPIETVLETLMILLQILEVILETIKTFLLDILNILKALVEALIGLLIELIEALLGTGLYAYFDIPDPIHDPNFSRVAGGYPAFLERFQGSLYDTKDFNRPQPNDLTTSGFILLVIDAANIITLIEGIKLLMRLFGKGWKSPRYEAPQNVKAIPVGTSGDPILAVSSMFTNGPIKSIELQWALPTTVESPDPGFADAFSQVADEFVPPNFLIEKSVDLNPTAIKIDIASLSDGNSTGQVTVGTPSQVDANLASKFAKKSGTTVLVTQPLKDDQQEPFIKFQQYIIPDMTSSLLGALTGTFSYIDDDVDVDHIYYYRIRAYSGDLNINETTHQIQGLPTSYDALTSGVRNNSRLRYLSWPTTGDEVVMGKPSGIVRASVPIELTFDLFTDLKKIFQVAFSLDFHLPLPPTPPGGQPPKFDATGAPVPPTPVNYVGRGSLTNIAGAVAGFQGNLFLDQFKTLGSPGQAIPESTFEGITMPWQRFDIQRNAARLANGVASAMFQLNGGEIQTFQDFMQKSLPRGPTQTPGLGAGTLESICLALASPEDAKDNTQQTLTTFQAAYKDVKLRQNVLTVITFLKNFTLGGVPPDWISIAPLRDLIPWAQQLLYDMLDKILALLAAFQGFLDEIIAFIDSLERKIDAMEKFIQFILDILAFIQDLNFGVFVLAANNLSGDVSTWITTIEEAGGEFPPSGPGGYTAGVALAYAAFDVAALASALELIFGG